MADSKSTLSSLPVLRLFDVSQPVLVSMDASPVGLGADTLNRAPSLLLFDDDVTAECKEKVRHVVQSVVC